MKSNPSPPRGSTELTHSGERQAPWSRGDGVPISAKAKAVVTIRLGVTRRTPNESIDESVVARIPIAGRRWIGTLAGGIGREPGGSVRPENVPMPSESR